MHTSILANTSAAGIRAINSICTAKLNRMPSLNQKIHSAGSTGRTTNSRETTIPNPDDLEQPQQNPSVQDINNRRPAVFKNSLHETACVLIFTLAVGCTSIAVGNFQITLDHLAKDFGVSGGTLAWSVSSINLANASFLLLAGNISDIIGRKNCIVGGFIWFTIASLICGFMHNYIAVVVLRALMGIAVSFSVPSSGGLLSSYYPISVRKNRVMACFAAGAPVGFCAGVVSGGICAEYLSWRASQFFLSIVYGCVSIITILIVPTDSKVTKENKHILHRLSKLDYGGGLLITAALTLVVFAFNQSSVPVSGWDTSYIIATLVVGLVMIICFIFYECHIPKRPVMPMFIWKSRDFSLAMVTVFFSWMCFNGVLTYFSILYFEQILNYSPLHTTACILPMTICGIIVNILAALVLHLVPGKLLLSIATASFAASAIIWATMDQHTSYWRGPFEAYCLAVIGADLTFNVVNMVTVNSVNNELQGAAQGIFQTMIQISTALGLALSNTIVSQKFPQFAKGVDLKNPQEVKELFHSFKYAYYFAIGAGGMGIIVSLFVKVGRSGTDEARRKKEEWDLKNKEYYEGKTETSNYI
ncbi:Amf1 protein [Saccharomycopsis crataegensis]|uniref:Amf1 protein n=1 Tax=Saccharomycopsis crataegensis TaxID=43959 RepID=A0AAV5QHQ0_9ASCO|nr:Amf1 protein [Saccharomycopsis crataegensis]